MAKRLATMNISLPSDLRALVQKRMRLKGFANTSEYVRSLIRTDLDAAREERIDELLEEGLNSGPGVPVTPALWKEISARARKRADEIRRGRRKKAG